MAVGKASNKLIIFEGIPGSGKTTLSKKTAEYLSKDHPVRSFSEGNMHPADLSWLACVPESEYRELLSKYPQYENEMEKYSVAEHGYKIIEFYNFRIDDKELFKILESYEIYGGRADFETFKDIHINRWSDFSTKAASVKNISVFECVFLQNHVNELLMFYGKNKDEINKYLKDLISTVSDLEPLIIYLEQDNVRRTTEKVSLERVDQKGEKVWMERVIDYICNSPFGKNKGLYGFEGMIEYLKIRQDIELEVLRELPVKSIVINNKNSDWNYIWDKVTQELSDFSEF